MKQRIVAGNWKMNTLMHEASRLVEEIQQDVDARVIPSHIDIVVCPPFPWISDTVVRLTGNHTVYGSREPSVIRCGAQDCHHEVSGAFTGDVSAPMLVDIGCRDVIVGHSERRQFHGETNELIARKIIAALRAGLRPIVCIGEASDERALGRTTEVVSAQIDELVAHASAEALNASVVAYEPLWAIGTGIAATTDQAQEVHALIRSRLTAHGAPDTPILYGGSVNATNAADYFACPEIDGALVGGAALSSTTFLAIINAACTAWSE
jgi:triosephosphate isomerase